MLPNFNASRLSASLQKEKEATSSTLGKKQQRCARAWEMAKIASDHPRHAGEFLTEQGQSGKFETEVYLRYIDASDVVRVDMLLDGINLGRFLVDNNGPCRYWVANRCYFLFFNLALQTAGKYLARQIVYHQLLMRRAQPFVDLLQAGKGPQQDACPLALATAYHCEQEWQVSSNYAYFRLTANGQQHELRVYGDRFTWGTAGKGPEASRLSQEEMMHLLERKLFG